MATFACVMTSMFQQEAKNTANKGGKKCPIVQQLLHNQVVDSFSCWAKSFKLTSACSSHVSIKWVEMCWTSMETLQCLMKTIFNVQLKRAETFPGSQHAGIRMFKYQPGFVTESLVCDTQLAILTQRFRLFFVHFRWFNWLHVALFNNHSKCSHPIMSSSCANYVLTISQCIISQSWPKNLWTAVVIQFQIRKSTWQHLKRTTQRGRGLHPIMKTSLKFKESSPREGLY